MISDSVLEEAIGSGLQVHKNLTVMEGGNRERTQSLEDIKGYRTTGKRSAPKDLQTPVDS